MSKNEEFCIKNDEFCRDADKSDAEDSRYRVSKNDVFFLC